MDDPAEEADELSLLIRRIIALLAVRRRTPGVARSAWGWGEVGEGRKNGAGEGERVSRHPTSVRCRHFTPAVIEKWPQLTDYSHVIRGSGAVWG